MPAGRQSNARYVLVWCWISANVFAGCHAIPAWHGNIHEYQLKAAFLHFFDGLESVCSRITFSIFIGAEHGLSVNPARAGDDFRKALVAPGEARAAVDKQAQDYQSYYAFALHFANLLTVLVHERVHQHALRRSRVELN